MMDTYGAFMFIAWQVLDINNGNQLFRLSIDIFLIINNLKNEEVVGKERNPFVQA